MTPDPDGDEAESLRAHSEAICADYLNAVKLPGECLSLTVELIGPKNRGHVSAHDIERAGHGLRIGVKIGDVAVFAETTAVFAETTGAGAPDEVVLEMVAAALERARKRAAPRRAGRERERIRQLFDSIVRRLRDE